MTVYEIIKGFESEIDVGDKVVFQDKVGNEKVYKTYKKVNDNLFELITIEDSNGKHNLTRIPDVKFDKYKVDLERGILFAESSNRWLNPKPNKRNGYVYTTLNGVPIAVHVVVAMSKYQLNKSEWLKEGKTVNHIDFDRGNNISDNLEVIYHKDQFCDEVRARMGKGKKLTENEARYIKYLTAMLEASDERVDSIVIHMIAKRMKRNYETIRKVILGKTHKDVGLTKEMEQEVRQAMLKYDLEQIGKLA